MSAHRLGEPLAPVAARIDDAPCTTVRRRRVATGRGRSGRRRRLERPHVSHDAPARSATRAERIDPVGPASLVEICPLARACHRRPSRAERLTCSTSARSWSPSDGASEVGHRHHSSTHGPAITWLASVPSAVSSTARPSRPLHVACIMDGNGRWAGRRGLPRTDGPHRGRGEPGPPRAPRRAPQHRLAHRVRLLDRELDPPARRGPPHPGPAREAVRPGRRAQRAERAHPVDRPAVRLARGADTPSTSSGRSARRSPTRRATPGMVLTVAFDYGGRPELVDAVDGGRADGRRRHDRRRSPSHLYLPELPPVDVLVRTSGEQRVSNFLLWQAPGAAIYFTDKHLARVRRAPSSTPRSRSPDVAVTPGDAMPSGDRRSPTSPPRCPAPRTRPGRSEMAERRRRGHRGRPAPRGPGRHRDRQDLAYLVPAIESGATRRRGHRDQGTAGPAGDEGPAVPRRAPRRRRSTGRC